MGLVGNHSRFLTTEVSGASNSGFILTSHSMTSMMKLINCLSGSDTCFWPFKSCSSLIRAAISEQPAKLFIFPGLVKSNSPLHAANTASGMVVPLI